MKLENGTFRKSADPDNCYRSDHEQKTLEDKEAEEFNGSVVLLDLHNEAGPVIEGAMTLLEPVPPTTDLRAPNLYPRPLKSIKVF